jgi:hypothetical protein
LKRTPILLEKNFSSVARELRKNFEAKFADPRKTHPDRFVWDYWHIENQYSALRTPARHYFPKALFRRLETALQEFGQRRLGCNGISDPWMSLYTDGCYQNLHSDAPHGPWAYVFSLTPWTTRNFRGGETLISRDRLLDFWPQFGKDRGVEFEDLFQAIPAEFNQLTVFDPRLPHGVKEVRGTREPREGRLVIHGWFVEPRPFVSGGLAKSPRVAEAIDHLLAPLAHDLARVPAIQGTASVRVSVGPSGRTGKQELLAHSLIDTSSPASTEATLEVIRTIAEGIAGAAFPKARTKSEVTIPFLFR